jgi:hypothetical protein
MSGIITAPRTVVFISKATPGDDEFALWLAPPLEAAGYTVYADICPNSTLTSDREHQSPVYLCTSNQQ